MSQELYIQFNTFLEEGSGKKMIRAVDSDVENFSNDLDRAIRLKNSEMIETVLNNQDELRRRIKNNVGLEAAIHFDKIVRELIK